eukprot:355093-Chlamydomonas_euryale.AAC.8
MGRERERRAGSERGCACCRCRLDTRQVPTPLVGLAVHASLLLLRTTCTVASRRGVQAGKGKDVVNMYARAWCMVD